MNVNIHKHLGRYNFASNDKDWMVAVSIDGKSISATWPDDSEPDTENESATGVIQMILDRVNSYWISTDRDRIRALADEWLTNGIAVDAAWAEGRILQLQRQSARLYDEINSLRINYLEAT